MSAHHLIIGETVDFITGEVIQNTHDEQYRQKLAEFLVETCGYRRSDLTRRLPVIAKAGDKRATVILDFAVRLSDRYLMTLQYGPGSLVTRHRSGLALSRILAGHYIPLVVVTNGEDADILDGRTGAVIGSGLDGIPSRSRLTALAETADFRKVPDKQLELESRILYAFLIDDSCPCDDIEGISACRPISPGE
ncbi:MAG: type I restriction enzyme HsdR N-terminal domain-containing protein [Desulfobacterales bacterium]